MYKFCPFCGHEINLVNSFVKCEGCNKSIYLNSKPTASVIFTYNDQILLCRRAIEPSKGKIDIIGGFLNNGEDPITGAMREVKEETGFGLLPEQLEYLGTWIEDYPYDTEKYFTFNMIYTVKVEKRPEMVPDDDISELVWYKIGEKVDAAFPVIDEILATLRKRLKS